MTSEPENFHHELDDLEASSVEKVQDRPVRNVQFGEFLRTLLLLGARSICFLVTIVIVSILCVIFICIDLTTATEWPDTPDPDRFTLPYGYECLFPTFVGLKDTFNMSLGPGPQKEGETTTIAKEVRNVLESIRANISEVADIPTRPIELINDRDAMVELFRKVYDGTNIAFYYDSFTPLQETNLSVFTSFMGSDLRNALLSVVEAVTSNYPDRDNALPTVTLGMREFASPAHSGSFGTDSLTGFFPSLWVSGIASFLAIKIFDLCKNKVLFYLRVSGMHAWILGLVIVVWGLIAIVPVTLFSSIFSAFVASSTKNSNFFILFISALMYGVGQWLFSCFLMPIFFPKAGIAIYIAILVLIPSIFMIIGGFRTAKIPDAVFIVFSALFPQSSYLNTFLVLSQVKATRGPMTMDHMNLKFNGLSMSMLFGFQVLNIILYGFLMVIAYLYCPRRFGRAPLKCGKCSGGKKDGSVANSGSAALIMDALRKEYKVKGKKIAALDSLSYTVNNDETIIIIGPNGAGKSTMINIITGMIAPDEGSIIAYGEGITNNFAPFYENLGVVFQENVLIADLTVKEHFRLIGRLRMLTDSAIKLRRENLMSALSFSDCLDKRACNLSGGQKRKLCIALALMSNPSFLIMDEPTAGVDVEARQLIWKTVSEANTTSMIATHSIEEGESVCTRMMIMSKGNIAFQGSPAELRQQTKSGYILSVNSENVDFEGVLGCIREIVPEAAVDPEINTRILIPNDLRMADVLSALESKKKKLRLQDYTVHLTNLEEQLVKLVQEDEFQS